MSAKEVESIIGKFREIDHLILEFCEEAKQQLVSNQQAVRDITHSYGLIGKDIDRYIRYFQRWRNYLSCLCDKCSREKTEEAIKYQKEDSI